MGERERCRPGRIALRRLPGSLDHRLEFAVESGIAIIVLETGPLQHAAITLYERNAYQPIPNFGKYVGDPNSVCYEKRLA